MRVIAGRLGGRTFDTPGTNKTHPMSERMCGALFNILGDIEGLTILDAFAGSGALSFEAYSRGAKHVTATESDQAAARTIAENINRLGVSEAIALVRANNAQWMQTNPDEQFDIVLCDPPYDDTQEATIRKLAHHMAPNGTLVLSWPSDKTMPDLEGLQAISERTYGNAKLIFYK